MFLRLNEVWCKRSWPMNLTSNSRPKQRAPPAPQVGRGDVLFTLFRHKWIILGSMALGILAAMVVAILNPPLYVSQAKLLLHYVTESKGVDQKEIEILTCLDTVTQAVAMVGPERILAGNGGGNSSVAAAGVIGSGIDVSSSSSPILTISFKNRDKEIVQQVLDAVIHAYILKRLEVYTGAGVLDEYWVKDLAEKLAHTEEELQRAKTAARPAFLDESGQPYETRIAKAQAGPDVARSEVAARRAALGEESKQRRFQNSTDGADTPADALSNYTDLVAELEKLKNEARKLSRQGYKEAHPLVQTVRGQLRNLSAQKAELERDFPALSQAAVAAPGRGTNSAGLDVASQLTEIKRLSARVASLESSLSNLQAQAAHVLELEPKIAELERQRAHLRSSYDSIMARLAKVMGGANTKDDKVINISVVQNPSPPQLDLKKMLELVGGALLGCIGLGVSLAFLLDRFLDRTIKGTVDVEQHLRMPVFLAIPDASRDGRVRLPRLPGGRPDTVAATTDPSRWTGQVGDRALASWDAGRSLGVYAAGLRERVWTYFEVHDMDLKKPKLVAVTGCGRGTGVSTLARGLASELSKTGDGNVLLVDVSGKQRAAHSCSMRKPGYGVSEVLKPGGRAEARVQERLYVARLDEVTGVDLALVLCRRFNYLVPKLKASDYDYIIFDMPPVSPTSPTPRLASHMDLTLLVLESERTEQKAAARAKELMHEAHANVAAVLNKCRRHVPEALCKDL